MVKTYNVKIPKNKFIASHKALFVIGDVHGEYFLLEKLVRTIKNIIFKLPKNIKKEVVFLGDYIDRGSNSKKTITFLINLQKKLLRRKNVNTVFLCGNHDEFFYKLINAKNIIKIKDKELNLKQNPLQDLLFVSGKNIAVSGLKRWMEIGGGSSTIRDYCPQIKNEVEKIVYNYKNEYDLTRLNFLINILQNSIPKSHKSFFNKLINNLYHIIDDFLIIHAGIFPNKKLIDQGIGKNAPKLDELNFLKLIMIRDEFLWAKKLDNCKYYIVHGHTPSERLKNNSIIPYTHNNFRLCLDTKVYAKNGSLTCFFKYNKKENFISISKNNLQSIRVF